MPSAPPVLPERARATERTRQGSVIQDGVHQDPSDRAFGVRVVWPGVRSTYTCPSHAHPPGGRSGDPAAIRAR